MKEINETKNLFEAIVLPVPPYVVDFMIVLTILQLGS